MYSCYGVLRLLKPKKIFNKRLATLASY